MTSLVDDPDLTRTKQYTRTIDILRVLHNSLVKIIESWEDFENGEAQYFEVTEFEALRKSWDAYLASIDKNMTKLRFLRRSLQQRIDMFDNKRNGVSIHHTQPA